MFSFTLGFRCLNCLGIFLVNVQMCYGSFFYLTGVSCAGFRDVTVVNGITARRPSQLVLLEKDREVRGKDEEEEKNMGDQATSQLGL